MNRIRNYFSGIILLCATIPVSAQDPISQPIRPEVKDTIGMTSEKSTIVCSDSTGHVSNVQSTATFKFPFTNTKSSKTQSDFSKPGLLGEKKSFSLADNHSSDFYQLRWQSLIVPGALIGFGLWGNGNDWFQYQNSEIRDELQENIDRKISVDDYSQFGPLVASYALAWAGVKPRHDFHERAAVGLMSLAISQVFVQSLKRVIGTERPDHSSKNSFPSGHTTMAFLGAEILYQEYRDVSPWIAYAGYAVAAGTGFFRMYNNRHWFTDVVAGAGFGILSTRLAYWLYPKIFPHHAEKMLSACSLTPFAANDHSVGLALAIHL